VSAEDLKGLIEQTEAILNIASRTRDEVTRERRVEAREGLIQLLTDITPLGEQ